MWERWRKGDTLRQIAQLFNRIHSSIQDNRRVAKNFTSSAFAHTNSG